MSTKKDQSMDTQIDNTAVLQRNITQLKSIVQQLEDHNTSIEYGISAYAQGIEIAKQSLSILTKYKGQLKELQLQADELIESDLIL
ncbi:MAG: exodeoxyribonuclease VII small subunit [Clostridiales bacterium]|jgi:exodeoxyribonuclease VII small subunit|nr:exodeoxyribonuclease VII small subunit [Clostridiales bacterium]